MRKLVLALSALLLLITPALAREPEEAARLDESTGSSSAVKSEIFVIVSRASAIIDCASRVQSAVMANAPAI